LQQSNKKHVTVVVVFVSFNVVLHCELVATNEQLMIKIIK